MAFITVSKSGLERSYNYKEILTHYYQNTQIKKI